MVISRAVAHPLGTCFHMTTMNFTLFIFWTCIWALLLIAGHGLVLILSKSQSPQVMYNSLGHPPQPNLKPLPRQSHCVASCRVTPFHHPPNIDSPTILVSVTCLPCSLVLSPTTGTMSLHCTQFWLCIIWDCRWGGHFGGWLTFSVDLNRYNSCNVTLYIWGEYEYSEGNFSGKLQPREWLWYWWWVFKSISPLYIMNPTSHTSSWIQAESQQLRPHRWQQSQYQVSKDDQRCGNCIWQCSLEKTWEMTELANHLGLLAKFWVSPLSCHIISILTLKVTHLACYGQEAGAVGELGSPIVKVQGQSQKNGELDLLFIQSFSNRFQVLDILKEWPYEVNLVDYFQDVDSLLVIAFQITIHNCRKHLKRAGEDLPASKHHGKAKRFQLHQGDSAQGTSAAEILKKKQGELEDRRKRRRDKMVHALLLFCSFCWHWL